MRKKISTIRGTTCRRPPVLVYVFPLLWMTVPALASAGPYQVGMVSESIVLMTVTRTVVVIWAIVLLMVGSKLPRVAVGTFLLAIGLTVGAAAMAHASLLLALAVAWLVVVTGIGLHLVLPRLVVAVSLFWPLPALYAASLFFSGSFERSMPLAIGLSVIGVILGAVVPRFGLMVLSVALGTVLLLIAAPIDASFVKVLVISLAAVLWQAIVLGGWRRDEKNARTIAFCHEPTKKQRWVYSMVWTGVGLALALGLVSLTAPSFDAASVSDSARLDRLAEGGGLSRPGLVVSSLNNFYVSGRPVPVAIVSQRSTPLTRLAFPFLGRNLTGEVWRMRAVKDDAELALLRRAATITSKAFEEVHPQIGLGVSEADIESRILESFSRNGATGVAFKGIVGSGANAVLPHYQKNDAEMSEGLVVIDIGCSLEGYASDMTRTFAVSGDYGPPERLLIETVIAAGDAARQALRPGVTLKQVDAASRRVIEEAGFGPYYTHSVGHHVGLNVHDPGGSPLESGMVLTIEPGIYIPDGAEVDSGYWNLGVRIEDTYIVTETGWEEITSYPRRPY